MTSALATLPPAALAIVGKMTATAQALSDALPVLPLETPEQEAKAKLLLRAIATLRGEGDKLRKAEKEPHLRAGKAIDDAFRGPDRALAEVDSQLRARLGEAAVKRERERTEALALAAEAARAGDAEAANAAMIVADDPVFAPVAGGGVSERWTYEAVAIDLAAVPLAYLAVDMVKVKAEIASAVREGRTPSIAGITFERKADFTVRKL